MRHSNRENASKHYRKCFNALEKMRQNIKKKCFKAIDKLIAAFDRR